MNRRRLAALLCGTVVAVLGASAGAASADSSHALIQASGSTWSANAINQWRRDVLTQGLKVNFTGNGSAAGRKDWSNAVTDFAVSDVPYLGTTPTENDPPPTNRAFAYLPVVAGGTAFPYHILRAGKPVTNLRLSGASLAGIFTGKITDWSDPAITKDNNGVALPELPIIPVLHSEGSAASYLLSDWLGKQYPQLWQPINDGSTAPTEYFPRNGNAVPINGADGVENYVGSAAANGAIGYNEYSYALAQRHPVAKIENAAGYFTLPTQYNVAVALTQAQIDTTDVDDPTKYLTQQLGNVYTNPDPRTYPLSAYAYVIIPTGAKDQTMTTAKRQTLADYLYHSLCEGQAEMGPIGYSPLPVNLVSASFDQVAKLGTADPDVSLTNEDVANCNNPTFVAGDPTRNYLAEIAPQPADCDQAGQGPCLAPGDTAAINANPGTPGAAVTAPAAAVSATTTGTHKAGTTTARSARTRSGSAVAGTTVSEGVVSLSGTGARRTSGTGAATGAETTDDGSGDPAAAQSDPTGDGAETGAEADAAAAQRAVSTDLAEDPRSSAHLLVLPLAVAFFLLVVLLPPVVVWRRTRRGEK